MKQSLLNFSSNPEKATESLRNYVQKVLNNNPDLSREELLQIFRRHLGRIQTQIQSEFEISKIPGLKAATELAEYIDGLITVIFDFIYKTLPSTDIATHSIALVATGGYGRKALAPFSDIDLLFLTSEHPSSNLLNTIEQFLYFLWDLGLKVGHATRSISECLSTAQKDITILTTLLDSRFVSGDQKLFNQFSIEFKRTHETVGDVRYIQEKRKEKKNRYKKFGETPYLVEPNIKEGLGGLRDLQTIHWECRYILGLNQQDNIFINPYIGSLNVLNEQEVRRLRRAHNFLWTVRFQLHYIAGRAEDRLTFDMQPIIGGRMGYTRHGQQVGVERFMRHYFLTAREITRLTYVIEAALYLHAQRLKITDYQNNKFLEHTGFALLENQLFPTPKISFDNQPIYMMRMLKIAQTQKRAIHPLAIHQMIRAERQTNLLRGDKEASHIFLDLLCDIPKVLTSKARYKRLSQNKNERQIAVPFDPVSDEQYNFHWLQILNTTGVLGQFIPEWRHMVGQMQFDTYHVFTVDQHSIEAVKLLALLEAGYYPEDLHFAYKLIQGLQSRRALYLATLLHDSGKGKGSDHSELGSQMAVNICARLHMSADESDTVSWLILHHLLLSSTAFQRDIDDPKTILDLVDTIQSPERLRLLFLLTVSDIRAVNDKVWNAWKATLLVELYNRISEVLEGSLATAEQDTRVHQSKDNITNLLNSKEFNSWEIDDFIKLGYASYWLSFDQDTYLRHAEIITKANQASSPLTVHTHPIHDRGVTEVTIYTQDHSGLFSKIAGALSIAGASIVDARIHTLTNGMILDTFWIQNASKDVFDEPHRLKRVEELIHSTLEQKTDIEQCIYNYSHHLLYGRRMRAIHVPPRVVIDNQASNSFTVIEINGRDRIGLLYDVTKTIKEQNLQISSAHITTYGIRAVDVFYVKDAFGLKIQDKTKLSLIRDAILQKLYQAEEKITGQQSEKSKVTQHQPQSENINL
ncbi:MULTISPECIES: [protein-PII] uridylyltransferase [unclassified Commensalibacter]|uniref:[protein-PII] uridylyltransferase n=1 Tax=unclassified Commensalibacter TaxID=2630218 RepID=UPI0018DCEA44|nr:MULTISPECIES: [protein-PII] uridylyltransferase [unclassified Commensalibacter]MBH9969403.1 [protein-PII] uridylyltransferase [Commensalibacter sp. M0265]MBH9976758.1 [protein-PII] uridylyltransferase [Commensalibacter sp. M0266]MBH9992305.1 [protein-PII] uridylyltransferase [Commensalibacter sp. M0270]MBI0045934.1 [protein-PII] uridylyltransferase [Commensalibacter sp. M0267]MBI0055603.1 [protein-PII] uridylyltransferase [Commensalibacter sp. M0268]